MTLTPPPPVTATKMRNFKRYPNRRLWDKDNGGYVTYPDIIEVVREGTHEVWIEDGPTGKDITIQVLLKAYVEMPGAPLSINRHLVCELIKRAAP